MFQPRKMVISRQIHVYALRPEMGCDKLAICSLRELSVFPRTVDGDEDAVSVICPPPAYFKVYRGDPALSAITQSLTGRSGI